MALKADTFEKSWVLAKTGNPLIIHRPKLSPRRLESAELVDRPAVVRECLCVRVCVRACARARVCVCVCVCVCVFR